MRIKYKGSITGEEAKAISAFASGNNKEALLIWESIFEYQPSNIPARKGIALSLLEEKKYDDALKFLQNTIQYASRDPELYNLIALCYLKQGKIERATNTILDSLEYTDSPLLIKTLEEIRKIKNALHARNISIIPLIEITFPSPAIQKRRKKKDTTLITLFVVLLGSILLAYILSPYIEELRTYIKEKNRSYIKEQTHAVKKTIKDIDNIISSRISFEYMLSEKDTLKKFNELKLALKNQHYNRAQILVNTLLNANISESLKERVAILENLISEPNFENLDYVPTYRDIVVAPKIYQNTKVLWQGHIVNIHHVGKKKTTFDLLIKSNGADSVEGIANVEIDGYCALQNDAKTLVTGTVDGVTPDYRVTIKGSNCNSTRPTKRHLSSLTNRDHTSSTKKITKNMGLRIKQSK